MPATPPEMRQALFKWPRYHLSPTALANEADTTEAKSLTPWSARANWGKEESIVVKVMVQEKRERERERERERKEKKKIVR